MNAPPSNPAEDCLVDPDVPVGGTTGLCHESSAAIDNCAAYLAAVPPEDRPRPLLPAMREMFGLTSSEVCAAIRESHDEIRKAPAT